MLEVTQKLIEAYRDEELYWEKGSWNMWHTREIETQNFINVLMKQKRIQNKIIGVYNEEGN